MFNISIVLMGGLCWFFECVGWSFFLLECLEKMVSDEKVVVFVLGEKVKEFLKLLLEFKIEDGIIIINNGKVIDIRKDKLWKN